MDFTFTGHDPTTQPHWRKGEEVINCPKCGKRPKTIEGRLTGAIGRLNGNPTYRRRLLCACGHRFTTFEVHEDVLRDESAINALKAIRLIAAANI